MSILVQFQTPDAQKSLGSGEPVDCSTFLIAPALALFMDFHVLPTTHMDGKVAVRSHQPLIASQTLAAIMAYISLLAASFSARERAVFQSTLWYFRTRLAPVYAYLETLGPLGMAAEGILTGVVFLIGVIIVITIGLVILYEVANSTPTSTLSSTQSSNLAALILTMTGAFTLAGIIPIVVVAGLIIGGFFLFLGLRGRGE